ncbi:hypothetical protein ACFL4W_04405 [Planctomycetota bacterium]
MRTYGRSVFSWEFISIALMISIILGFVYMQNERQEFVKLEGKRLAVVEELKAVKEAHEKSKEGYLKERSQAEKVINELGEERDKYRDVTFKPEGRVELEHARYKTVIQRNCRNGFEAHLIKTAENEVPDRARVEAAMDRDIRRALKEDEKRVWWYGTNQHIRLPYAITREAIGYFAAQVAAGRKGKINLEFPKEEHASSFVYHADVAYREDFKWSGVTFEKAWVVEMRLRYDERIQEERLRLARFRTVVFDTEGQVLMVTGDGARQGNFQLLADQDEEEIETSIAW